MIKIRKLKNGASAIIAERLEAKSVALLVIFRVGSRYEQPQLNGISHFLEHLFFKGTERRPNTLVLTQELDKIGAIFNAFTGKDFTGYYIKVAQEQVHTAFDILSDMLTNSLFDEKELKRERGVIIEEIRMYKDNPIMYIDDLIERSVYQGHSLAQDIAGPEKNIRQMTRKKIIDYHRRYYYGNNTVFGVVGNISKEKAIKMLNDYFAWPTISKKATVNNPWRTTQNKPRIVVDYKKTKQIQLSLAWPSFGRQHPDYLASVLLALILGGNMSSRLFINIRERHGLCYSIRSEVADHQDNGYLEIRAGLNQDKIELAYQLIIAELQKIKKELVPPAEIDKAKTYWQGKLSLQWEDSLDYLYWLMKQYLDLGETMDLPTLKKKINSITAQDVQRVAQKILLQSRLNLAVIGPYHDKKYFNNLINKIRL